MTGPSARASARARRDEAVKGLVAARDLVMGETGYPRRVTALDLGTSTGVAAGEFVSDGFVLGVLDSADYAIDLKRGAGYNGTIFANALSLFDYLAGVSEIVVYEQVNRWSSSAAAKRYCGLLALLELTCFNNDKPLIGVPIKSVKMHFTGNGIADKNAMVCRAETKLLDGSYSLAPELRSLAKPPNGGAKLSEDAADALAILDYFLYIS